MENYKIIIRSSLCPTADLPGSAQLGHQTEVNRISYLLYTNHIGKDRILGNRSYKNYAINSSEIKHHYIIRKSLERLLVISGSRKVGTRRGGSKEQEV